MKTQVLIASVFFHTMCCLLSAQQPLFTVEHYTSDNGLSQKNVADILQSSDGYMWFGTNGGLDRYDGYDFENFSALAGDSSTFCNRILFLEESVLGNIWCITYDKNAYLFDTSTEQFVEILQATEQELQYRPNVEHIYPLSNGITWITCENGEAFRIDEQHYTEAKAIKTYNAWNKTLNGKKVYKVYLDEDGDEWVLTDQGVHIVGQKHIGSQVPFRFLLPRGRTIYLLSRNGDVASYGLDTQKLHFITSLPDDIRIQMASILHNGCIAIATNNGLLLYDTAGKTITGYDMRSCGHPSNNLIWMDEDSSNNLWIFTESEGVVRLDCTSGQMLHLSTPDELKVEYERHPRTFIYEDRHNNVYVLPRGGNLSWFNPAKQALEPLYTTEDGIRKLYCPLVRLYVSDTQGNLWLGLNSGLEKMSFPQQYYQLLPLEEGMEIRALMLDKHHNLWAGSKNGSIRLYDRDQKTIGYLSADGRITPQVSYFGNKVYCIKEDRDGRIWIGSKPNGLFRLTPKGNGSFKVEHFRYDPADPYSLSHDEVYSIEQDAYGNIWVGTYGGGLNLVGQDNNGKLHFINHRNDLHNYPAACSKIRHITAISDSVIMVGTTEGLLTFDPRHRHPEELFFYRNTRQPAQSGSLGNNDVKHIYKAHDGTIYIATFSGGVSIVQSGPLLSDNIRFKTLEQQDGLASNITQSVIEDGEGLLWIASENSLSIYNPADSTCRTCDPNFIHSRYDISEGAPIRTPENNLLYGTMNGILQVFPEKNRQNNYQPPIVFTNIRIQGKSVGNATHLQELRLKPDERNVSLLFAALDYSNHANLRYTYRMVGLEDEWHESDNNRMASYQNLPHGDYVFQVKSTNGDGVWVENIRSMPIHVQPKFHETGWAWLLYAIALIIIGYVGTRAWYSFYMLRHRVALEKQLSNLKLRFFTDISHELRTPLTLITSPVNEVLATEQLSKPARENLELVKKNTDRMLRLVNQILDFRKIQNDKMKIFVEEFELTAFIREVVDNFAAIADEKHIIYTCTSNTDTIRIWTDRDKLEKIIFNLLSNAFKYTPPYKSINVQTTLLQDKVSISVIDEGIGIRADKASTLFTRFETLAEQHISNVPSSGIGLSLVKELTDMLCGTIGVESRLGAGSNFTLTLPLGKAHFEQDPRTEFILADSYPDDRQTASPEPNSGETASGQTTLLIVEDNNEMRMFLRNILAGQYLVFEATNGKEGLQKARETEPDLIVSDVMMPEMDGLQMLDQLKHDKETCHIPIILLSAKSALDDRIEGITYGADDYISKPFSSTYLKARIHNLMEQRRIWQQSYMEQLMVDGKAAKGYEPAKPQIMPQDKVFMQQVMDFINKNIEDAYFSIDNFAEQIGVSRSILYRKLKTIVGLSPIDFVMNMRIKRACQLMDSGEYNIAEVAYKSGFTDPKYFSKCFKKQTGQTPTDYKNNVANSKQDTSDKP